MAKDNQDSLPLEDRVRKARSEGASYRQLCKRFKLSPNQVKPILDGEAISSIEKLKKQKVDLEQEVERLEKRAVDAKKQIYEVYNYKPYFEMIEAVKKAGGPKRHLLETWLNHLMRCGISETEIEVWFRKRDIKGLELDLEILDVEERLAMKQRLIGSNLKKEPPGESLGYRLVDQAIIPLMKRTLGIESVSKPEKKRFLDSSAYLDEILGKAL